MAKQMPTTNGAEMSTISATPDENKTASLYVGDLNYDVTEATLYEFFKNIGKIESIRVCRNAATRESLGYAYVNFANEADADKAIETHNFQKINGRACRIMWSRRDSSLRKSGVGNVFIKNLHPSITSQHLYDALSRKGTILSCKVAADSQGKSKGYGFVHFENQNEADRAIKEFQAEGALLNGHQVYIGPFIPRKERQQRSQTSIIFKNLETLKISDAASLKEFLSKKQIFKEEEYEASILDIDGNIFGFIYFKEKENVEKPLESLTTSQVKLNFDSTQSFTNIYAKNLERTFISSTEKLNELFSKFGKITSSQLMVDASGQSKGFGFVNFENFESAYASIELLNNKEINGLPVYLSKAQTRSERDNFLANLRSKMQQERSGVNIYIKHLDDSVDENKLLELFSKFGEITSVKVMRNDKNVSRGFGFVCFATPEQAASALASMNNYLLEGKPIYLSFAQTYADRKSDLAKFHSLPTQRTLLPPPGALPPPQFVLPPHFNPFPFPPPPRIAVPPGPHIQIPQRPPQQALRGSAIPPGFAIPPPGRTFVPLPGRVQRGAPGPIVAGAPVPPMHRGTPPRQVQPSVPLSPPMDEFPIFATIFESEIAVGTWKQTYGDLLAKRIQLFQINDEHQVYKITGMINEEIESALRENTIIEVARELFALLYAPLKLEEKIREAISILKANDAKE